MNLTDLQLGDIVLVEDNDLFLILELKERLGFQITKSWKCMVFDLARQKKVSAIIYNSDALVSRLDWQNI